MTDLQMIDQQTVIYRETGQQTAEYQAIVYQEKG